MTPKQFYHKHLKSNKQLLIQVAERANTNFGNFKQIAIAKGSVSRKLAKALEGSSGSEMTVMEILFPEDFEDAA